MTAVNYIYRNTKFDGRVEHRNIRFEVSIVTILTVGHHNFKFINYIFKLGSTN